MFAGFRGEQAVADGGQQLVDVGQLDAYAGPHDEVQVVVLGVPRRGARRIPADTEVVVLVQLMAGVEVEYCRTQAQRRQQPRLYVVELRPAGRGSRHVQAPRLDSVDVDRPHDALRIGVGAGDQVERFVLGSVDGFKDSGARSRV